MRQPLSLHLEALEDRNLLSTTPIFQPLVRPTLFSEDFQRAEKPPIDIENLRDQDDPSESGHSSPLDRQGLLPPVNPRIPMPPSEPEPLPIPAPEGPKLIEPSTESQPDLPSDSPTVSSTPPLLQESEPETAPQPVRPVVQQVAHRLSSLAQAAVPTATASLPTDTEDMASQSETVSAPTAFSQLPTSRHLELMMPPLADAEPALEQLEPVAVQESPAAATLDVADVDAVMSQDQQWSHAGLAPVGEAAGTSPVAQAMDAMLISLTEVSKQMKQAVGNGELLGWAGTGVLALAACELARRQLLRSSARSKAQTISHGLSGSLTMAGCTTVVP